MENWLIMPKMLYFWLSMAIYASASMLGPHFVDSWGLKYSEFGYLCSLQVVNFFGAMFWTSLADRTGRNRDIIILASMMYAICFGLQTLPLIMKWEFSSKYVTMGYTFGLMAITWMFQAAMFPLTDSAVISKLSQDPTLSKDQFGYQRLFGSLAHVAGTYAGGYAKDHPKYKDLLFAGLVIVCSAIFSAIVAVGVPAQTVKNKKHHGPAKGASGIEMPVDVEEVDQRNPVVRCLTDPNFFFYILFVVSAGLLANTLTIFQPLYTKEKLQFDNKTVASLKIPSCVSEITIWLTSRHISSALGYYWLLILSQLAGIIRIFGYQFLTIDRKWLAYVLESSKGLNSGLIVTACVQLAAQLAPRGCESTAQGLFSGVYKGISYLLAGVLAGVVLPLFEENILALFLLVGAIATCCVTGFFFKFLLVDRALGFPGFPARPRISKN